MLDKFYNNVKRFSQGLIFISLNGFAVSVHLNVIRLTICHGAVFSWESKVILFLFTLGSLHFILWLNSKLVLLSWLAQSSFFLSFMTLNWKLSSHKYYLHNSLSRDKIHKFYCYIYMNVMGRIEKFCCVLIILYFSMDLLF